MNPLNPLIAQHETTPTDGERMMGDMTAKVGAKSNRGSKPGERRGGRQKGTPNKLTATIKGAIEVAFDKAGGADYLVRMATEQPVAFMTLLGKVLPTQLTGGDEGDAPIKHSLDVKGAPEEVLRWLARNQ